MTVILIAIPDMSDICCIINNGPDNDREALEECRVLKLADKPSCLGGGGKRINAE
jgi:hypothetical protein